MTLIDTLFDTMREHIEKNEMRRKYEEAYEVSIDIDAFTSYLSKRVKGCVDESVSISRDRLEAAVRALRYARNLVHFPMSPKRTSESTMNLMMDIAQPYVRVHESFNLLDDALLLAMSGRYTPAFSVLRTSIESIVAGVFYHCLCVPGFRKRAKALLFNTRRTDRVSVGQILDELLTNNPELAANGLVLERALETKFQEYTPPVLPPGFNTMLKSTLEHYDFPGGLDAYDYIYNTLYGPLSAYTHVMSDATTLWQKELDDELVFDSGLVNVRMLDMFIGIFFKVLDSIGALFVTAARTWYNDPGTLSSIVAQDSTIHQHGTELTLTNEALDKVLGLKRLRAKSD